MTPMPILVNPEHSSSMNAPQEQRIERAATYIKISGTLPFEVTSSNF